MKEESFRYNMRLDYTTAGKTRCNLDCPETGHSRDVSVIVFSDGGSLVFPADFSSRGNAKKNKKSAS